MSYSDTPHIAKWVRDPSPYPDRVTLSAGDVANVLRLRQPGLGIKKLHKLLYYAQGHHLATFGTTLFHESVSAWDMGPVVGALWYSDGRGTTEPPNAVSDEAALNTIGYVLSRCGALTGRDLEVLTHNEDPWCRADQGRDPGGSAKIEPEWMKEFFSHAGSAASTEDDAPLFPSSGSVRHLIEGARDRLAESLSVDDLTVIRARLAALL